MQKVCPFQKVLIVSAPIILDSLNLNREVITDKMAPHPLTHLVFPLKGLFETSNKIVSSHAIILVLIYILCPEE
jgi:hypothetical protein